MKNKELIGGNCPIYKYLDLIGKKWTIFILFEFYKNKEKKLRYSDIKKSLGTITPRTLSLRLKELVDYNLLIKEEEKKNKLIIQNYSLSKSGKELKKAVVGLIDWSKRNCNCSYSSTCSRCKF